MSDQHMWLVVSEFEPEAVTNDFEKGIAHLEAAFCKEYNLIPEKAAQFLGVDMKLGEWCLTFNQVRQRGFHVRKIETL